MIYRRNGKIVESLPDDFYSTKDYTDQTCSSWIKKDHGDGKPFFAYLSYTAPHDPLHAPREYIEKYKGQYDEGWDALREKRLEALKALGIVPEGYPCFSAPGQRQGLGRHDCREETGGASPRHGSLRRDDRLHGRADRSGSSTI